MPLRPTHHFVQRRPKRGTKGSEAVLHLQARLTDDGATHEAIAFQLPQVLGQHIMGDVTKRIEVSRRERTRTSRARKQ